MKSVCICYWGVTRTLRHTYNSHLENILNIFKSEGWNFDIFIHCWKTQNHHVWNWHCDVNDDAEINFIENVIKPYKFVVENQDEWVSTFPLEDYIDHPSFVDSNENEWLRPTLIKNHICSLYSQKIVTQMVFDCEKHYDYVLYIRPDAIIESPFPIQSIPTNPRDMLLPNHGHWMGLNDQMAFISKEYCSYYGNRIDELDNFRKPTGILTDATYSSEMFILYISDKYFECVLQCHFPFYLLRP